MTTPLAQSVLESTLARGSLLALFVPYQRPIGATTEADGVNCGRYYSAIVESVGASAAPWSVQFCNLGQLVFLPASNVDAALAAIWGAIARADAESSCWLALRQSDGAWRDLIPERGELRLLPAEIQLLPKRLYELEAELNFLIAEQETIKEASAARREEFDSGRVVDAVLGGGDEHGARIAWVSERIDAVRTEIAGWRTKLAGGQS